MFLFGNRFLMFTCTVYLVKLEIAIATEESLYCMCAEWGLWSDFGPCSAHCGGGLKSRKRNRLCRDDIFQTTEENNCVKKATQFQVCNTQECGCEESCTPWSEWYDGACTLQCGGGVLISSRTRQCHGTIGCSTKEEVSKDCNIDPCTGCVCDEWSTWSDYGPCTTVCGTGEQKRNRVRNCKPKLHCLGASIEYDSTYCNLGVCCHDACTAWSHWNEFSCSASCDYGVTNRTRNRVCALQSCKDREDEIGHCKTRSCPETCDSTCTQWGPWSWTPCSESCNGGHKIGNRTRTCVFQDCLEQETSREPCNEIRCPVCNEKIDCSEWGIWTEGYCSTSCDIGIRLKTRSRSCNSLNCNVIDTYDEVCMEKPCEDTCDATCSSWSSWYNGECSQSCGEGQMLRHRNRTCAHNDCTTTEEAPAKCNINICSDYCDSNCSTWGAWKSSGCSVSCGGGELTWTRERQCHHPNCSIIDKTGSSCNAQLCDEKCDTACSYWSAWESINACSATCNGGQMLKLRKRECFHVDCSVEEKGIDSCNQHTCPESCDALCTPWSEWFDADCSSSCGLGMKYRGRGRNCSVKTCPSIEDLTVPCQEGPCPNVIQNDHGPHLIQTTSNLCLDGLSTYIPHPTDCEKFIQCAFGRMHVVKCPNTTGWNSQLNACDYKKNILGCE